MKIKEIIINPSNPRLIKDERFKKLVKSIKEFPKMMELRPMVIDENNIVIGGNMRLKALKELGYKEIPDTWVKKASDLTPEEVRRFIIADNVGFGENDWEVLKVEWDVDELEDWGMEIPEWGIEENNQINESDLFDIELPFYTPSEICPTIKELASLEKTKNLIDKINKLNIENDLKEILIARASFFTDFNFQKIADYYYNQENEIKEIFKDLGMIILAPKEALQKGFIELKNNILEK